MYDEVAKVRKVEFWPLLNRNISVAEPKKGVNLNNRPLGRDSKAGTPDCETELLIVMRRGADKSLAFPISYFPIFCTTKKFFLDGLKKLEQRSHKCVELRGEYVE
jgi:hypothetical protein